MLNNKGYTLLEMILVLSVSSVLLYSALYFPNQIIKAHKEQVAVSDRVADNYVLKNALIMDLNYEDIEQVDSSTLRIGDKLYVFDDTITRDGTRLTRNAYEFELTDNLLKVYNDDTSHEYVIGKSFNKESDY